MHGHSKKFVVQDPTTTCQISHCFSEIDECESTPCHFGGTCTDYVAEYTCDCVPGTNGTFCEISNL